VVARTSCCSDQSKDDQTDHDQNLGAAEPKLELSEESNAEVVNCDDCSQEKRHIESRVCAWAIMLSCFIKPEPYDESRSNQIVRGGDYVFEPVIPTFKLLAGVAFGGVPSPLTKGKAKSRINEAMGEACEAGCERQPSSHLPLGFVSMNEGYGGFGAAQHTIALITAKQRTPIRA
jgi:hypothetical protein